MQAEKTKNKWLVFLGIILLEMAYLWCLKTPNYIALKDTSILGNGHVAAVAYPVEESNLVIKEAKVLYRANEKWKNSKKDFALYTGVRNGLREDSS